MRWCFNDTTTWVKMLRVGSEDRTYKVQLDRQIGCFSEACRLFVNEREMDDLKFKYNPFSPVCGSGGRVEFEQDGHRFLLIYDSLFSFGKRLKKYHLFIDGVNAISGLEYSAYWRRRGWQLMSLASLLILVGLLGSLITSFIPALAPIEELRVLRVFRVLWLPPLVIAALIQCIFGMTLLLRHKKPSHSLSRVAVAVQEF